MTELKHPSKDTNNKTLSAFSEMWRVHIFVLKSVWLNSRKGMLWTIGLACFVAFLPYFRRGAEALLINYLTANFGSNVFTPELFLFILAIPTVIHG